MKKLQLLRLHNIFVQSQAQLFVNIKVLLLFVNVSELHSDLEKELKEFRNHLLATGKELVPLKAWQLQGSVLGLPLLIRFYHWCDVRV